MKIRIALVGSLLMAGCRGPEVTVPVEYRLACPTPPDAENLVAFWRFDDGSTGEDYSKSLHGEVVLNGPRGMLSEDRLGGLGHGALFLGGDSAYGASVPGTLDVLGDLTLAAWVSLPQDWLAAPEGCEDQKRALEVVSVTSEGVGLARLEILHVVGAVPLLRVWVEPEVEGQVTARQSCAELPSEFGHWGRGRWYHVAGTMGTSPALYVDGMLAQEVECPLPQRGEYTTHPVSTGQLVPPGGCDFGRLLDDIALFQPPLAAGELPGFLHRSQAVVGPDGRAWSVQGVEGSVAEWQCGDAYSVEAGGLQAYFENKPWSAPRLLIDVQPVRIGAFRRARLRADIPIGEPFELELEGQERNHYCVWPAVGRGDDEYEFVAEDVAWCECPGQCPCDFTVGRASIESRWDTSSRYEISVSDIDFDFQSASESSSAPPSDAPPRSLDVLDWCWRPVTYDPTARARLGPSDVGNVFDVHLGAYPSDEVVGTLEGTSQTTAFLGADFVGMGAFLNLEDCDQARVQATVEPNGGYAFRLVDAYGVLGIYNQTEQPEVVIDLDAVMSWIPPQVRELGELDSSAVEFTSTMVRFVGIGKPYNAQWSESTVRVKSIEFEPPGCAQLTDAKLTAPLPIIEEVH